MSRRPQKYSAQAGEEGGSGNAPEDFVLALRSRSGLTSTLNFLNFGMFRVSMRGSLTNVVLCP